MSANEVQKNVAGAREVAGIFSPDSLGKQLIVFATPFARDDPCHSKHLPRSRFVGQVFNLLVFLPASADSCAAFCSATQIDRRQEPRRSAELGRLFKRVGQLEKRRLAPGPAEKGDSYR